MKLFVAPWLALACCVGFAALPATARADCDDFPGVPAGQTPPYSPALLEKTYDCVRGSYTPGQPVDYDTIEQPLIDAGIGTLMYGDGGLPLAKRVQILNDYGFWQYKDATGSHDTAQYGYAINTLKLVTELAPTRALAWMNLGDTYATAAAALNTEDDERPSLINQAVDAYHRYTELTPKPAQHVQAFLAQHPYNPAFTAVCKFVATALNTGDWGDSNIAFGAPVDLLGDGKTYYVNFTTDGTMQFPSLSVSKTANADPNQTSPLSSLLDPLNDGEHNDDLEGVSPGDNFQLFSYKKKIYLLHEAYSTSNAAVTFSEVVQPGHGVICHTDTTVHPSIDTGKGNPLCDALLRSVAFVQPKETPPPQTMPVPGMDENYQLFSTADVDLEDDGHKQTVATYVYDSAGPVCDNSGLLLYDPKKNNIISSPLNDAIRQIPLGCRNENEFLISYGGNIYIEVDNGTDILLGEPAGAAIYAARREQVRPVCTIRNKFTYTAQ